MPPTKESLLSTTDGCPTSRWFFARCGIPRTPTLSPRPALTPHGLASLAREALIAEAELTPKPGLVDRRGSGAHHDLSLPRMHQSATAIEPYLAEMALRSQGQALDINLRSQLAAIGRDAERAMYHATQGSNSHKGAIWILGLLIAAAIRLPSGSRPRHNRNRRRHRQAARSRAAQTHYPR